MSGFAPPLPTIRFRLPNPEATQAVARHVAHGLQPGDTLLLDGPVGAGKSHFARALILHRLAETGRLEDVPSPTFTLVQQYDDGRAEIWHADLYRLSHPDEAAELGLEDAFRSAICLVEWPDRLGPFRPPRSLDIGLAHDLGAPDARLMTLQGSGQRWHSVLKDLAATFPDWIVPAPRDCEPG